jgi:hypothetical protein
MGHYDNCYEHDAEEKYREEREGLQDEIVDSFTSIDNAELKFLRDVAIDIKSYKTFFRIMKKHSK